MIDHKYEVQIWENSTSVWDKTTPPNWGWKIWFDYKTLADAQNSRDNHKEKTTRIVRTSTLRLIKVIED